MRMDMFWVRFWLWWGNFCTGWRELMRAIGFKPIDWRLIPITMIVALIVIAVAVEVCLIVFRCRYWLLRRRDR